MAYWSAADDDPPTYHTCKNCPSGQQILPRNRKTGTPPSGRSKCVTCKKYERDDNCR